MTTPQIVWSGRILGVQPRIDLTRSFDQRSHSYLGYLLAIDGIADGIPRPFTVRIGPGAQSKHEFRAGDVVSGKAHPVADREREVADLYRASGLKVQTRSDAIASAGPPWLTPPPPLPVFRERGHRRLDVRTFDTKCNTCSWGCRMAVALIVDQWNPVVVKQRFETFCYGPKSCPWYRGGPTRKAPGRNGMSWEEEDWVDEEAVAHRGSDD